MRTRLTQDDEPENPCGLSELFHENTKQRNLTGFVPRLSAREARWLNRKTRSYPSFEKISLEEPQELPRDRSFADVLTERASVREFSSAPMQRRQLATLMHFLCGIRRQDQDGYSVRHWPSAGGLFPLDMFLAVQNVRGLDQGLYYYEPFEHAMYLLRRADVLPRFQAAALGALEFVHEAPVCLVFAGDFGKTKRKYGERGYRYVLLDAGHLGQNGYLLATAMGFGACGVGGFNDCELDSLIGLDGVTEGVVYLLLVGIPAQHVETATGQELATPPSHFLTIRGDHEASS